MNQVTPVTIFSGYLGSGKTTIILNALKQFKNPVKFAMIKNEFGDVNVDAALARNSNLAVKEVVNGCLCCILVGDLNPGVNELLEALKPERIIIEASGNALPFPIVLELKKNPRVYIDGVIVVVDAANFDKIKDKSFVARDQAKHTDLIIFNKTNLVSDEKLYHVKEEVYDLNPDTVKIETADGMVDPGVLFGLSHDPKAWTNELEHSHDHSSEVETFVWETSQVVQIEKVEQVLQACRENSFYRIKGIIQTEAGKWQLVNGVFGRFDWKELKDFTDARSRIVFIGHQIKQWEEQVKAYLDKATV